MYRIDITWTGVSCCLVCSCISWFTHCLISHVSLMVAVPVSHLSASPKKGNRLLLDHGFSGGDRCSDSVLNCTDCKDRWLVGFIDAVYAGNSSRRTLSTKCDASGWPWNFTSKFVSQGLLMIEHM